MFHNITVWLAARGRSLRRYDVYGLFAVCALFVVAVMSSMFFWLFSALM
jgi:hypothetical protein